MQKGVESAAEVLNAFLDAELSRLQLSADRLALVGFSQGTMMSLHIGLKRVVKPAAIVGYSGMLASGTEMERLPPDTPPILLIHGDADPMIPPDAMFATAGMLGHAGACVQWHLAPGVGHGIDPVGLEMGGSFLGMAFRQQLRRRIPEVNCPLDVT
jgi:phospholipase/carboxylesterase